MYQRPNKVRKYATDEPGPKKLGARRQATSVDKGRPRPFNDDGKIDVSFFNELEVANKNVR